jgi:hypothetical protein
MTKLRKDVIESAGQASAPILGVEHDLRNLAKTAARIAARLSHSLADVSLSPSCERMQIPQGLTAAMVEVGAALIRERTDDVGICSARDLASDVFKAMCRVSEGDT